MIASYTRLAKAGASAVNKLDKAMNTLEGAGNNSDNAVLNMQAKMGAIADITSNAQGDSSIMTELKSFETIMGSVNGIIQNYTEQQGDQNGLGKSRFWQRKIWSCC